MSATEQYRHSTLWGREVARLLHLILVERNLRDITLAAMIDSIESVVRAGSSDLVIADRVKVALAHVLRRYAPPDFDDSALQFIMCGPIGRRGVGELVDSLYEALG